MKAKTAHLVARAKDSTHSRKLKTCEHRWVCQQKSMRIPSLISQKLRLLLLPLRLPEEDYIAMWRHDSLSGCQLKIEITKNIENTALLSNCIFLWVLWIFKKAPWLFLLSSTSVSDLQIYRNCMIVTNMVLFLCFVCQISTRFAAENLYVSVNLDTLAHHQFNGLRLQDHLISEVFSYFASVELNWRQVSDMLKLNDPWFCGLPNRKCPDLAASRVGVGSDKCP